MVYDFKKMKLLYIVPNINNEGVARVLSVKAYLVEKIGI
jgi:hypothetical protein